MNTEIVDVDSAFCQPEKTMLTDVLAEVESYLRVLII